MTRNLDFLHLDEATILLPKRELEVEIVALQGCQDGTREHERLVEVTNGLQGLETVVKKHRRTLAAMGFIYSQVSSHPLNPALAP